MIEGTSLYKVQKLLGHESPLTTQRYAHLAPEQYEDIHDAWNTSAKAATRELTHDVTHEETSREAVRHSP